MANVTTIRSADTRSTATPNLGSAAAAAQLPLVYASITNVQTAALRCQRSDVSIEVSSNSPRSAKSTASETPGGGGSAAGRHVVRRVILQACSHPVTLGRQRELIVISARHPTMLAMPAGQTRIELRLQWFIR